MRSSRVSTVASMFSPPARRGMPARAPSLQLRVPQRLPRLVAPCSGNHPAEHHIAEQPDRDTAGA